MPRRPPHPCQHPGCGVLVYGAGSRCPAHAQQQQREQDQRRGSSTARGYGSDWQRLRRRKLRVDPLCEDCKEQGRATLAVEVHHKIRITERPDLRLNWENLRSLCEPCHDAHSAAERSVKPIRGCGLDGTPIDPGHPWNRGTE